MDVGDLEGEVVRAGAIAVEEPAKEVVAFDVVGSEDFEPNAFPEAQLGGREAGGEAAGEPSATKVARVAGKGLGVALDGNGDVIKVDVVGVIEVSGVSGHAMMLAEASLGSQAVQVIGFDHLVLAVSDVERSLSWYMGALGLPGVRVEEWRRGEVPFPSVRVSPVTIIDVIPRGDDAGGRNVDHLCLVVEPTDLVAWAESAGLKILDGPDQRFGAQGVATSIYVHDPDGNTVELRHY